MERTNLIYATALVGEESKELLDVVDYYTIKDFGVFVAAKKFGENVEGKTFKHPSYYFILMPSQKDNPYGTNLNTDKTYTMFCNSPETSYFNKSLSNFIRNVVIVIDPDYFRRKALVYNTNIPEELSMSLYEIDKEILIYINKYIHEYLTFGPGREDNLAALKEIITSQIIRSLSGDYQSSREITKDSQIQDVIQYMRENFGDKLNVNQLAKLVGLSRAHFLRIFKREMAMSPMSFLNKLRFEEATKQLRDPNLTITDVALTCGFGSASHFSSSFFKHLGMTPTEYRKKKLLEY